MIKKLYESDNEKDIWHRAIYKTQTNQINFKKLVIGMCNTDFPKLKPHIEEEIFFLNLDKKLILNIYDDRGMDVILTNKEKTKKIYKHFSKWILDYDRDVIENQLK